MPSDCVYRGRAVGGRPHDPDAGLAAEQVLHPDAAERLVVHDDDPDQRSAGIDDAFHPERQPQLGNHSAVHRRSEREALRPAIEPPRAALAVFTFAALTAWPLLADMHPADPGQAQVARFAEEGDSFIPEDTSCRT